MNLFSLFPHRCVHCGVPGADLLCRACQARFQSPAIPDTDRGRCPTCGQVLLGESLQCTDCSAHPWSFPEVHGVVGYQESSSELVRLYKFAAIKSLAYRWGLILGAIVDRPGPLVPVPALREHLWARGWDPVSTLTRALSRATGYPVWNVLRRRRSASQKELCGPQRFLNAHQAYRLLPRKSLSGLSLAWVVDDVVTTGATVEACSRLLRDAGVQEVQVLCLGLH